MVNRLYAELEQHFSDIVAWRRHLHRHPELSFREVHTPRFIAEHLTNFGLTVKTGVGGNGVVGVLEGGQEGGTIAFRADFDALPIADEKEVPYRSTVEGVMHACGHDGHTAALLGAARALGRFRHELKGNVVFLFQHAEEMTPGGARAMIEDGCLDGVDAVYGAHLATHLPVGTIGSRSGPLMAAADAFDIQLRGKGGHGGRPHEAVDALLAGTQVVHQLHHLVGRRVNPLHSAVVSVGVFQAGTASNIVADRARIQGTVRTFDPDLRRSLEENIRLVVKGVSEAAGVEHEIAYKRGYPVVVNHRENVELVRSVATELFGPETYREIEPSTGAEDFAYYLQHRPGAFYFVGARGDDEATHYPHHHPKFDFDERALLISAKLFVGIAARYLLGV
jgi:amidohydrolase